MKQHIIYTFAILALLLAATACTNDELGNGTLPQGARPLVINASGLQAIATPQTRGTLEGNWDGVETVGVRVDIPSLPLKKYKVEAEAVGSGTAHLSPAEPLGASDMAFWWTSTTETKTVTAWCPYGEGYIPSVWTIPEEQTAENMPAADLLFARKEGMTLQNCETGTFEFRHMLSKVRINLKASEYLQSAAKVDVRLLDQYTMADCNDMPQTLVGTGGRGNAITPCQLETPEPGCYASYEALVIPLDADEVAATDELISVTACYYGGDIGTGILEDRTGIGDATKVDGSSGLWNWEFATGSMNNRLGPDFGWHWQTDNRYTPPTLVPNN